METSKNLAVRVDTRTHMQARMFALQRGITLAELVTAALRVYIAQAERRARKARK